MNRFVRFLGISTTAIATLVLLSTTVSARPPQICHCDKINITLNDPNIKPSALLNWARDAAVNSFQYSFFNTDHWMQNYSVYFSPDGWQHYYKALKHSGNLDKVKSQKITATATPLEPPVILWEGVDSNVYRWGVQIPVLVQYKNDSIKVHQKLMVTMVLRRSNPPFGVEGIAIDQFVAKPLPESL